MSTLRDPAAPPTRQTAPDNAPAVDNVQKMHDAIHRELNDPTDGFEPIPMWVMLIFGGVLAYGGWYMAAYAAEYRGDQFDLLNVKIANRPKKEEIPTDPAALKALGSRVYNANCVACHQSTGLGGAGIPPLAQSEWVAGNQSSPERLARILLHGLNGPITVKGNVYNAQMPAWGQQLKDHQIAGVLSHIRQEWGNADLMKTEGRGQDPAIPTAFIAKMRGELAGRSASWTEAELKAVPLGDAKK